MRSCGQVGQVHELCSVIGAVAILYGAVMFMSKQRIKYVRRKLKLKPEEPLVRYNEQGQRIELTSNEMTAIGAITLVLFILLSVLGFE
jgi:hypothetical protein